MFNKDRIKEVFRFGIVGVIATVIQYVVYIGLYSFIGVNISYTIGYIVSLCFNFILSNYFTFKTKPSKEKGVKFILAHGFNYLLQIGLLNLFIYINIPEGVSPIIVYCIIIPINYLVVRRALNKIK